MFANEDSQTVNSQRDFKDLIDGMNQMNLRIFAQQSKSAFYYKLQNETKKKYFQNHIYGN